MFGDSVTLQRGESEIKKIDSVKISEQCEPILIDLFCRYYFPPCDTSLARPHARRICRTSCAYMIHGLCEKDLEFFRQAIAAIPGLPEESVLNCTLFSDTANGGDVPECYQYHTVPGQFLRGGEYSAKVLCGDTLSRLPCIVCCREQPPEN